MLGEQLVKRGWISRETLALALSKQQNFGSQLGTNLLDIEAITEAQLMSALSADMHLPIARTKDLLGAVPEALALLSPKLAVRAKAIPFRVDAKTLDLATVNATDLDLIDELSFAVGKRIKVHISHEARIAQALEKHYGHPTNARITNILDRIDREMRRSNSPPSGAGDRASSGTVKSQPAPELQSSLSQERKKIGHVDRPGAAETMSTISDEAGDEAIPAVPEAAAEHSSPAPSTIPLSPEELFDLKTGKSELQIETSRTLTEYTDRVPRTPIIVHQTEMPTPTESGLVRTEAEALEGASSPDEIGDILLRILSPLFARVILLRTRNKAIVGWKAWGADIDQKGLREFSVGEDEPSIFSNLKFGSGIYKGHLAQSPAHDRLSNCWRGGLERECVLAQIKVRDRPVCIFYGDWMETAAQEIDFDQIASVAAKASTAFETCIMMKKMRRG